MYTGRRNGAYGVLSFIGLCGCVLIVISNPGAANGEWPTDPSMSLPICNDVGSQYDPRLVKVSDGYVVVWQDERRVYRDIYAQKFDVDGNVKWIENGRVVAAGNNGEASNHLLYNSQSLTGIAGDTQGGVIVLWTEDYSCQVGPCGNVWMTRVHSNGDVRWGASPSPGVTIQARDTAVGPHSAAAANAIAPDGEGGAFGIYGDDPWGGWYVFRIDANGAFRAITSSKVGARGGARMIYGGNANSKDYVNIAWWDYGSFATKVNDPEANYPGLTDTLSVSWNKITLTTTPAWWSEPSPISDGAGGMIVVWEDSRGGDSDIFAQKISADGTVQWTPTGVPIVVQPGTQRFQKLVSDGAGGAVIVWEDMRASPTRIYAQRVGADGNTMWAENGIPVSSTHGESPKIIASGDGAYIIVWVDTDHNGGTKDYLRAQKISAAGYLLWPIDSITPSGGTTGVVIGEIYSADFDIASDGGRGFIAVWELGGDIYAKRVMPDTLLDTAQKLYIGYYQRPADPGGLAFWANGLAAIDANHDGSFVGENIIPVLEQFAYSDEARTLYGGDITPSNIATVIDSIYVGLFGRHAEADGLSFWVNSFNTGALTPATVLWELMKGAQGTDAQTVQNRLMAASRFTLVVDPNLDGLPPFDRRYAGYADCVVAREWLTQVTSDPATIPTEDEIRALLPTP
jgi:hypothetical protein